MAEFFIDVKKKTHGERFDMGRFMAYTDNFDPFTSSFIDAVRDLPENGQYVVQGEDGRPDQLSFNVYGETQFWWILLIYNRKKDYRDIATGETIRFPSVDAIENAYFQLLQKSKAKK